VLTFTLQCWYIGASSLVFFDYLILLDKEVKLVWSRDLALGEQFSGLQLRNFSSDLIHSIIFIPLRKLLSSGYYQPRVIKGSGPLLLHDSYHIGRHP
jgi:hypothetical protein